MVPAEALHLGLLNHLVPREALEAFPYELAPPICGQAPRAIRVLKQQLQLLSNGHALDAETCEPIQTVRCTVYHSEDAHEGIRAFQGYESRRTGEERPRGWCRTIRGAARVGESRGEDQAGRQT